MMPGDKPPDHAPRGEWGARLYPGADAARKRLHSCGLSVTKIEAYRGHKDIWEATTNAGQRWIRWVEGDGWTVTRVQPGRKRA
jgi:hypothetical protein